MHPHTFSTKQHVHTYFCAQKSKEHPQDSATNAQSSMPDR